MEAILQCPLGKKCEWIEDNKIFRCSWYIQIAGKHPQSEEMINESGCAIAWMPVLLVENAQTNRGQTEALESFRNEVVIGQTNFNRLIERIVEKRKLIE